MSEEVKRASGDIYSEGSSEGNYLCGCCHPLIFLSKVVDDAGQAGSSTISVDNIQLSALLWGSVENMITEFLYSVRARNVSDGSFERQGVFSWEYGTLGEIIEAKPPHGPYLNSMVRVFWA